MIWREKKPSFALAMGRRAIDFLALPKCNEVASCPTPNPLACASFSRAV
jgi:hypothetical protein